MSLSGCRPADVVGWSSRNREPALGPRLTTSSADPDRQALDAGDRALGARRGRGVQLVEEVRAENRCRLHGDFVRRLVALSLSVTRCSSLAAVAISGRAPSRNFVWCRPYRAVDAHCVHHRRIRL